MGSKSKSKQTQGPSPNQMEAGDALLDYVLGPGRNPSGGGGSPTPSLQGPSTRQGILSEDTFAGSPNPKTYENYLRVTGQQRPRRPDSFHSFSSPTGGSPSPSPGSSPGAGNLPGTILPNFGDLEALAGDKFFNSLTGDNVNPVFSEALDNIFNPSAPDSNINYSPGDDVAIPDLGTVVGGPATQQALDQLLNRPSIFDDVTGGPIVDRIDELTNQQLDAVSGRLASEREDALDDANSNLAAGGLLSSNQVFRAQEEIIGNSLDDFTMQALDFSRDNIKVLSDLAMQDAQLGTQSAQAVLQSALQEKGINADLAAQIAKINADRVVAIQAAQIQSQTQLMLGQQSAGLDLLNLGLDDFQFGQDNQLDIASLPLELLLQMATGGPTVGTSTSKGGKSL